MISSDHREFFEINFGLQNWLSVVTSSGCISQKVVSCVSSNPGIFMTGIVGFYSLMTMVDLLLLPLTENLGM